MFRRNIGSFIAKGIVIVPCSFNQKYQLNYFGNYRRSKMSEHVTKNKEREEITPGIGFMGFLMITAAIYGLYFLPTLMITLVDIVR